MNRPTIILIMTPFLDLHRVVAANLAHCGFHVINLAEIDRNFRYPNLALRLKTQWRKHFLKDNWAKRHAKVASIKHYLDEQLDLIGGMADYTLCISADLFHPELLAYIRSKTRQSMACHQWDGMHRYPEIWACVPYFDRFFVFDNHDLTLGDFLPNTNFYFDHLATANTVIRNSLFFKGSHQESRAQIIQDFADYATQAGWQLDFQIVCPRNRNKKHARQSYPNNNVVLLYQRSTYAEYLTHIPAAGVLVDFLDTIHNGLSLRTFEALGYRKKLITTNRHVAQYDFYHPNNIYILTPHNFAGVQAFLDAPYHELQPEIYQKYGFGNWIRYVLNIEPHIKIDLPNT